MTTAATTALAAFAVFALLAPGSATAIQPAADEYQFEIPGVDVEPGGGAGQVVQIRDDRDRAGVAGETIPVEGPLEAFGSMTASAAVLLLAAIASLGWVAVRRHRVARAG